MRSFLLVCLFSVILCTPVFSQENKKDYSKLSRDEINELSYDELLAIPLADLMKLAESLGVSVDDLLNMKITVSSKAALTSRESPGIVSIVTADEIKNSGARDLIDVLNLVPGFQFGYDVDGVIGLASRGNWGHEGKILILLDGQEMNDNFYSTYQFGNRIPLGQIKRIEIIRGPGSSVYGGYAELGVINIITKDGGDLKGFTLENYTGLMSRGVLRDDINLAAGNKLKDFDYSISAYYSQGHRSNEIYTNFNPYTYDMAGSAGVIAGENLNLSLGYKDLKFRFIYDNYKTQEFDYFGLPFNNFTGYYGELKYDWKFSDKLTITPKLNIKEQEPWRMSYAGNDDTFYFDRTNIRSVGSIIAQYQPIEKLNIVGGLEGLTDMAKDLLSDTSSYFINGKKHIFYYNLAAYLQCILKTDFVNINIGGRLDRQSKFGYNFAPRLGITKVLNKFHFKILFSEAFRTPAIENIDVNDTIKPERTYVTELETGYQFNKSMFITANVFDIRIQDPIVYNYFDDKDHYLNYESTGTRGLEIEYRFVKSKGYLTANYSFYFAQNNNVEPYEVQNDPSYLLGFAKHKATLNAMYKITENLNINPSFIFTGYRYAYILNNLDSAELHKGSPVFTLNLFINYNNFLTEKLNFGIGVYDILNNGRKFIEPYHSYDSPLSGFPPLPGYNREFLLRLNYRF